MASKVCRINQAAGGETLMPIVAEFCCPVEFEDKTVSGAVTVSVYNTANAPRQQLILASLAVVS